MTGSDEATEIVNEFVMESARADEGRSPAPRWHRKVAISTLFMALITAAGALLAGITAHETLIDRTQEMIDISMAENEKVSVEVLRAKVDIIRELGATPDPADLALIRVYDERIAALEEEAEEEESRVQSVTSTHLSLAISVTIMSVAITLSGMAVIVEQKSLWYAGMIVGLVGTIGVLYGAATMSG